MVIRMRKPDAIGRTWEIEQVDKDFLMEQLCITRKAYDESGFYDAGPLENLLGLVAEYAFDGLLNKYKVKYQWNKRRVDYWQENADRRDWDFKLSSGLTFELGAARPYHTSAVLGNLAHKLTSDYFVQVKILKLQTWGKIPLNGAERWLMFNAEERSSMPREITDQAELVKLEASEKNVFALARIEGFDKISDIRAEKGEWRLGKKGVAPTVSFPGYYEDMRALRPFNELVALITGKPAIDDQPKKNFMEQSHF